MGTTDPDCHDVVVGIIGAGVSGLTLATLLRRSGISCVVLERRSRSFVETRQRAGNIEARAVRMFEEWGIADKLVGGIPYDGKLEVRELVKIFV